MSFSSEIQFPAGGGGFLTQERKHDTDLSVTITAVMSHDISWHHVT